MGLDTVELVMAFEEEFGIIIDNDDAAKIKSPGDVADYVITKVRTSSEDQCLSQIGFYKIRTILMKKFDVPRKTICPRTLLKNIIGKDVRDGWKRLKKAIGADYFPKLERKRSFFTVVVFVIPVIVVFFLLLIGTSISGAIASFLFMVVLAELSTSNLGNIIPSKLHVVEDLIPFVGCSSITPQSVKTDYFNFLFPYHKLCRHLIFYLSIHI